MHGLLVEVCTDRVVARGAVIRSTGVVLLQPTQLERLRHDMLLCLGESFKLLWSEINTGHHHLPVVSAGTLYRLGKRFGMDGYTLWHAVVVHEVWGMPYVNSLVQARRTLQTVTL